MNKITKFSIALGAGAVLTGSLSACAPAATGARLESANKSVFVAPAAITKTRNGAQSDVRFAYGYTDGSVAAEKSLCAQAASTQASSKANYGVVICQGATPLSYSALRESDKDKKNFVPDNSTKLRLAQIASAELSPAPSLYTQE